MDDAGNLGSGFSRLEPDRLQRQIDVLPAQAGAISEPLTSIKPNQNQAAPVTLGGVHKGSYLLRRKNVFTLWFVFQRLNRQRRIYADETLPPRGVECARENCDVEVQGRRSEATRLAAVTEIGNIFARDGGDVQIGSPPEKLDELTHRLLVPQERRGRSRRSEERRVGKECRSRWSPYH